MHIIEGKEGKKCEYIYVNSRPAKINLFTNIFIYISHDKNTEKSFENKVE